MEAVIAHFRQGRHHCYTNQMIIKVPGVEDREKAAALKGKMVVFKTDGGKELKGKISSAHGNSGAVRAIFESGMPGQAIGKKIEVQ